MKRPAPWQARRIATQKALKALPRCEYDGCAGRGMGWLEDPRDGFFRWACTAHAAEARRLAQKQRAAAPRET